MGTPTNIVVDPTPDAPGWHCQLENAKVNEAGDLAINVLFYSAEAGRKEHANVVVRDATEARILSTLRAAIAKLDASSTALPTLEPLFGQWIEVGTANNTPTQDQIDFLAYQVADARFRTVRQQRADGIDLATDEVVTQALKDLNTAFKPEYLGK